MSDYYKHNESYIPNWGVLEVIKGRIRSVEQLYFICRDTQKIPLQF